MSGSDLINVGGVIKSLRTSGMTTENSIWEALDNAPDARATRAHAKIDTRNRKLIIADDGEGMDPERAENCYRIHDVKDASDKNGLRGIGKAAGEAYLSNCDTPTRTYTKTRGAGLIEVVAQWPRAIATGTWRPTATEPGRASSDANDAWAAHCLDPDHGTVVEITLHPDRLRDILANRNEFLAKTARNYQFYPPGTVKVFVDGEEWPLPENEGLGWDRVGDENRYETKLRVWKKENPDGTSETRVYHKEGGEYIRFNPRATKVNAKHLTDYATVTNPENGWVSLGKAGYKRVYDPLNRENPGYTAYRRNKRVLFCLPNATQGNRGKDAREYESRARTVVSTTYCEDHLVNPLGNKSGHTSETINSALREYVQRLNHWLAHKDYVREQNRMIPEPVAAPAGPAAAGGVAPDDDDLVPVLTKRELDFITQRLRSVPNFLQRVRAMLREMPE